MARTGLSDEDKALLALPPMHTHLPIVFASGYKLIEFCGECIRCKRQIEPALFRGRIDRTFERVAIIQAVGACHHCRLLTRFNYRVHDDLSITGVRDGRWRRWESRIVWTPKTIARSIFRPVMRAVRWLFSLPKG